MKTIAHEVLDIESEDFEVPRSSYDTLEAILKKAKRVIDVDSEPIDILLTISIVLRSLCFNYKEVRLLSNHLQTKEIDCMGYSLLYHSIGEELGLPIAIALAPGHMFVRFNIEGKAPVNWETTSNDEVSDEKYISTFNISKEAISNGFYLSNLTREEIKAEAVHNCGIVKRAKGDLDRAIFDLNRALELNPNIIHAYYNRGNAKQEKGDLKGAISDYDKAIELDPNHISAYINRGAAKQKKGDLDGAISDYDKAIELNPNNTVAYCNLGLVKMAKGDLDWAISDLNRALELDPNYAPSYFFRGKVKERKGDLEGAKKDFEMYERLRKK